MDTVRKVGGFASLGLGITFSALIALLITATGQGYTPGSGNNPRQALEFAAHSPIPYVIYLLYALLGILMVLVVVALSDRLRERAPAHMRLAIIAASVTAVLFLAYAMLGFVGEPTLVRAYRQDAALGEAAYLAARVVSNALNTGAIFAAGWAILLAGLAAIGAARFPKLLAYLLALAGVLSVLAFLVPPLSLIAPLVYIVWSVWLGAVLLRGPNQPAQLSCS